MFKTAPNATHQLLLRTVTHVLTASTMLHRRLGDSTREVLRGHKDQPSQTSHRQPCLTSLQWRWTMQCQCPWLNLELYPHCSRELSCSPDSGETHTSHFQRSQMDCLVFCRQSSHTCRALNSKVLWLGYGKVRTGGWQRACRNKSWFVNNDNFKLSEYILANNYSNI